MAHRTATQELAQAGHFHDQVQIVAVFEGWRSFVTPAGTFRAEAGQIVVLPAHLFHAPLMCARSAVSIVYLNPEHPAARLISRPAVLDGRGAAKLEDIVDRAALPAACAADSGVHPFVAQWIDVVARTAVPIEEIADAAGYSIDGFSRLFSRQVGTTPSKYRIAQRLNVARALLRQGATPADAAYGSGFADQSHLGRCFLRAFGTTPGAYRAGMAAG